MGSNNKAQNNPATPFSKHELYLQDWEAFVLPIDRQAADAYKAAVDYSVFFLKSVFVLNGGALVALPAILSTFRLPILRIYIVGIVMCFIVGIVMAVIASLIFYSAVLCEGKSLWKRRAIIAQDFLQLHYKRADVEGKIKTDEDERHDLAVKKKRRQTQACWCVVGSTVLFLLGACTLISSVL